MAKYGRKVRNLSLPKPISAEYAKQITNAEIWLREFNSDYAQVVKRNSKSQIGLRYGAPPGTVS